MQCRCRGADAYKALPFDLPRKTKFNKYVRTYYIALASLTSTSSHSTSEL